MNKKRTLRLAAFLDTLPRKKFDMHVLAEDRRDPLSFKVAPNKLLHGCGTVGCIAGYANALARVAGWRANINSAREWLGLGFFASHNLFYDMSIKTPKQAAKRLRELLTRPSWETDR